MTGYARKCNEDARMSFIVKDKKLLKKYSKIWEAIEGLIKITLKVSLFMVKMLNT